MLKKLGKENVPTTRTYEIQRKDGWMDWDWDWDWGGTGAQHSTARERNNGPSPPSYIQPVTHNTIRFSHSTNDSLSLSLCLSSSNIVVSTSKAAA